MTSIILCNIWILAMALGFVSIPISEGKYANVFSWATIGVSNLTTNITIRYTAHSYRPASMVAVF